MPRINLTKEEFLLTVFVINDNFVKDVLRFYEMGPSTPGEDIKDQLLTIDYPHILTAQICYRFKGCKYFSAEFNVDRDKIEKLLEDNGYEVTRKFEYTKPLKNQNGPQSYKEGVDGKRYQKGDLTCIILQSYEGPLGGIPAEFICDDHTMNMFLDNFDKISTGSLDIED